MLALTIAIVALGLAGYAVYVVRKMTGALLLAEAGEEGDEEAEVEVEVEPPHIWVSDGECYIGDMAAFLASINAVGLCNSEGVPCAVIPGVGVVSLHKLFSEQSKAPKVQSIK